MPIYQNRCTPLTLVGTRRRDNAPVNGGTGKFHSMDQLRVHVKLATYAVRSTGVLISSAPRAYDPSDAVSIGLSFWTQRRDLVTQSNILKL